MKKYFAIITVPVMLLFLLSSCSVKSENIDALLYTKGLELIQRMDIMAESEEYINLMSASTELGEVISRIGEENYSEPKTVYKIIIPEEAVTSRSFEGEITGVPEELKKEIERRFISAVPVQANASKGSIFVAATSIITTGDSFINDGLKNNTLYIYLYEGEYSAMVSFFPGKENIVGASAGFVINDSLNQITSEAEMSEWIAEHVFLGDCEVEEVELGK